MRSIGRLEISEDGITKRIFTEDKEVYCKYCHNPLSFGSSVALCEIDSSIRCTKNFCLKDSCFPQSEHQEHIDYRGMLILRS